MQLALTLLIFIIPRLTAEKCSSRYYEIIGEGVSSLPSQEILSSYNLEERVGIKCYTLCYKEPRCVGFIFRTRINVENCQLTNVTKERNETGSEEGEWTLFRDVEATKKEERQKSNESGTLQVSPTSTCSSLYKSGERKDGVYTIDPDGLGPFQVMCDMQTSGGGWTVFQKRLNESVNFYREWNDYKNGFGELNGSFWLGLDKIHRLTKSDQVILRVDLMDFENNTAYAEYKIFSVASELNNFTLYVGSYSGNAGDALDYHDGMKFSTKERDNDHADGNCALAWESGWWFKNCHTANLNGDYLKENEGSEYGIFWWYWKYDYTSMEKAEMKIRAPQF